MSSHKQIRQARLVLEQHYEEAITIEDLSRRVALSPFYLIRKFRHIYKQTPHQYLIQRRITRAKELLRNTDMGITEICIAIGFDSPGSFSTLFSKTVGLSPRAYRTHSQPTTQPAYIPLCICRLHGIKDDPSV